MQRKNTISTGNVYHVMSKSIAGYQIFNSEAEYERMLQITRFFSHKKFPFQFSKFIEFPIVQQKGFEAHLQELTNEKDKIIQIITYCVMPTHVHFVLKQLQENGVATAVGNMLNAYTRYFNIKHKRQGPLWASRFKNVPVDSDEQLLHLSRYVHLNPVSAGLVRNAKQWKYSSYAEYITPNRVKHSLCDFQDLLDVKPAEYQTFVDDHADYQRKLARIKKLALE